MPQTFVLINCKPGIKKPIIQNLDSISQVKKVQGTYGDYDLITSVESDDESSLKEAISEKNRKIKGIRSTMTLIEIELEIDPLAEIIPDIIPDEKKPLDPPSYENLDEENDDEDFDNDDDQDYKIKENSL